VDCVLSPDGRWLGVMESSRVAIIDPVAGKVASRVAHAGGGSFTGIAFSPDSKRLYAATVRGAINVFDVEASGELEVKKPIRVPAIGAPRGEDVAEGLSGPSPAEKRGEKGAAEGKAKKAEAKAEGDGKNAVGGLAIDREGKTLWAVLNMRNTLAEID